MKVNVPVPIQESVRLYLFVLGVSILHFFIRFCDWIFEVFQ